MELKEKVETLLSGEFSGPGDKVVVIDDDGIIGYVTSARFEDMDMRDRVDLIWDLLESGLTKDERRGVFTIAPLTPLEEVAHSV